MPVMRALRTNGLRQRHWARIYEEVPALKEVDRQQLTLHTLLQVSVRVCMCPACVCMCFAVRGLCSSRCTRGCMWAETV